MLKRRRREYQENYRELLREKGSSGVLIVSINDNLNRVRIERNGNLEDEFSFPYTGTLPFISTDYGRRRGVLVRVCDRSYWV